VAAAAAGDVIEIDAAGTYDGDTCAWSTDALTLRGVNGRPHIDDTGVHLAESKGVFVVHAATVRFENLELSGASVPDRNGAAIRHQGTDLEVVGCYLHDNEDGILGSPITDGTGTVTITSTELAYNGYGDGYSHNAYLGHYASVVLRDSWSHGARVGHLFKSRALENEILYNRLTDETGGSASYELDLPNAGRSVVVGNLIEQEGTTQNSTIVAYGEESSGINPDTTLVFAHNTVVNRRSAGTFVVVGSAVGTPALLVNNLFVGPGTLTDQAGATLAGNWDDGMGDPLLADVDGFDYHLTDGSPCVDAAVDAATYTDEAAPVAEYVHPLDEIPRQRVGASDDIGAYELGNTGDTGDSGNTDPGDSGVGDSGDSGAGDSGAGDSGGGDSGDDAADGGKDEGSDASSGCGCASTPAPAAPMGGVLIGLALVTRRRMSGRR
jgi:MYXO-CTERM domain-containing protein